MVFHNGFVDWKSIGSGSLAGKIWMNGSSSPYESLSVDFPTRISLFSSLISGLVIRLSSFEDFSLGEPSYKSSKRGVSLDFIHEIISCIIFSIFLNPTSIVSVGS